MTPRSGMKPGCSRSHSLNLSKKNSADGLNRFSSRLIGILDISRTFVQISRQSWTVLSLIKFGFIFKGTNCCNTKKKARKWLICYRIATHYMYFHHSQIIQMIWSMKGRSRICVSNTVTPSFQPIFPAYMNSKYLSYRLYDIAHQWECQRKMKYTNL